MSDNWEESCRAVLERVFRERVSQVARYGHNEGLEEGVGPHARWLSGCGVSLDLENAETIQGLFRREYEKYTARHGAPTWMHLVREEVAEAFECEPGSARLVEELIQVAALCVKWVEAVELREN